MNNKKGFISFAVIVAIILGVGLISLVVINNAKAPEASAPSVSPNSTSTLDITTSSTLANASWQTYRNEKYGFEVKYPLLGDGKSNLQENTDNKKFFEISYSANGETNSDFGLSVSDNKEKLSPEKWFTKNIDPKQILWKANKFVFEKLANGNVLLDLTSGTVPVEFEDTLILSEMYLFAGNKVFTIIRSQDHNISALGLSPKDTIDFERQILMSIKII